MVPPRVGLALEFVVALALGTLAGMALVTTGFALRGRWEIGFR